MIGQTVDHYKIIKLLGRNAVAETLLAQHTASDERYVLKMIRAPLLALPGFKDKLLADATKLLEYTHPRVLPLENVLDEGGRLFMVQRYVETLTLAKTIRNHQGKPFPLDNFKQLVGDVLNGLEYLHNLGQVPRFLNPKKIMVTQDDHALLRDYGTVLPKELEHYRKNENLIPSARFYSPERFANPDSQDVRNNVYSMGIVLFQMTTGKIPFGGKTYEELQDRHARSRIPSPQKVNPAISKELSGVILKAISKKPADRYQTIEEFRNALGILAETNTVSDPFVSDSEEDDEDFGLDLISEDEAGMLEASTLSKEGHNNEFDLGMDSPNSTDDLGFGAAEAEDNSLGDSLQTDASVGAGPFAFADKDLNSSDFTLGELDSHDPAALEEAFQRELSSDDDDPFAGIESSVAEDDPFAGIESSEAEDDPFAGMESSEAENDPFAGMESSEAENDPFAGMESSEADDDPFAGIESSEAEDDDPFAAMGASAADNDPFAAMGASAAEDDPFAGMEASAAEDDPFAAMEASAAEDDPFAAMGASAAEDDPFAGMETSAAEDDPFAAMEASAAQGDPPAPADLPFNFGEPTNLLDGNEGNQTNGLDMAGAATDAPLEGEFNLDLASTATGAPQSDDLNLDMVSTATGAPQSDEFSLDMASTATGAPMDDDFSLDMASTATGAPLDDDFSLDMASTATGAPLEDDFNFGDDLSGGLGKSSAKSDFDVTGGSSFEFGDQLNDPADEFNPNLGEPINSPGFDPAGQDPAEVAPAEDPFDFDGNSNAELNTSEPDLDGSFELGASNSTDGDDFGFGGDQKDDDFGFGSEQKDDDFGFGNEQKDDDFGLGSEQKDDFGFGNEQKDDDFGLGGDQKDDFGFGGDQKDDDFGFGGDQKDDDFGFGSEQKSDDLGLGSDQQDDDFGFGSDQKSGDLELGDNKPQAESFDFESASASLDLDLDLTTSKMTTEDGAFSFEAIEEDDQLPPPMPSGAAELASSLAKAESQTVVPKKAKPKIIRKFDKRLLGITAGLAVVMIAAIGYWFVSSQRKKKDDIIFSEIQHIADAQQYDEALDQIASALARDPSASLDRRLRQTLENIKKDKKEVVAQIRILMSRAIDYEHSSKPLTDGENDAFGTYMRVLSKDPKHEVAFEAAGRIKRDQMLEADLALEIGEDLKALKIFSAINTADPNDLNAKQKCNDLKQRLAREKSGKLRARIEELFAANRYEEMVAPLQELEQISPDGKFVGDMKKNLVTVFEGKAQQAASRQKFAEAEKAYALAMELNPKNKKLGAALNEVKEQRHLSEIQAKQQLLARAISSKKLSMQYNLAHELANLDPGNSMAASALETVEKAISSKMNEAEELRGKGQFKKASNLYKEVYDITQNEDILALWDRYQKWAPPAGMSFLPMGAVVIGERLTQNARPPHKVTLSNFFIDRFEVTNRQYKAFVDAKRSWSPELIDARFHDGNYLKHWTNGGPASDDLDRPVVFVSWHAAKAYASYLNKRLPTEAEWEKAARGSSEKSKYWWGNYSDAKRAVYDLYPERRPAPVGSFPANPFNIHEILGNVNEWVEDTYDSTFYERSIDAQDPVNDAGGPEKVLRGGSFKSRGRDLAVYLRFHKDPRFCHATVGFRCALDASSEIE